MANTNITRTCTAGNRRKWTWSAWIKRTYMGTEENLFTGYESSTTYTELKFNNVDQLQFQNRISNTWSGELKTNRKFRDVNAWYHIVIVWDSENTNSAAQRMRMYINGVEESSFATRQNPSNPTDSSVNWASRPLIYGSWGQNSRYFNGLMSHVNFVDGTVYTPSEFGSTDSTTGEWKIKTDVSVTYGTNGSFILKDGNSLTDQSGEGNNFTAGTGTLTQTFDNPSNVFATWNYVSTVGWYKQAGYVDFYNGSTKIAEAGGNYKNATSTVGAFTGKYYFETKMISPNNSLAESTYVGVITATDQASIGDNYNHVGQTANSVGYNSYNGQVFTSDSGTNYGSALATGDILCVALDVTNKKVYFRKNADAWFNSGDPTSGSTGTGAVSLPTTGDAWLFGGSPINSSIESNFGNGYFGQSAVSSAGTPGSTPGTFEYDVPSGYEPLTTKGLNT